MLTEEERRRCAADLLDAARTRRLIVRPSLTLPGMTVGDAYHIQHAWVRARLATGSRLVGYKIGLTSQAAQIAWQTTEPMYGRIFDDAVLHDRARVPAAAFLQPRLEVELAFILGSDLQGPDASIEHAVRATERVVPAFEIIAQRTESPRPLADAVADNAAFGAIVLGSRGMGPQETDVAAITATLEQNGIHAQSGAASAVMSHPAAAVAWLANALHAAGERLEQGQVILTGTLTRAVEVSAGDVFRAEYGPLGRIEVSFV